MPDSGLFAVLVALFAAVIIGANTPDGREGLLDLRSEVSLLSVAESGDGGDMSVPDPGSDRNAYDDPHAYFKIPNFVFQHLAIEIKTPDRMACQRACNENAKCRSYSYREPTEEEIKNQEENAPEPDKEEEAEEINDVVKNPPKPSGVCLWSPEGLQYTLGWKFYTKAKDVDWQGRPHLTTENFHVFPGLEYQESSFETHSGQNLEQCRTKCAKDPKCGAFSFNDEQYLCRLAGSGVHYDPHFSYYEKPGQNKPRRGGSNLDEDAVKLAAQEKAAKTAEKQAGAKAQQKRDKEAKILRKKNRFQRIASEKAAKQDKLKNAEEDVMRVQRKEVSAKDLVKVQESFTAGYFTQRGMAQEKKTKEVKLKQLELKNREEEEERESEKKSGEYKYKKRKSDRDKKVAQHELNIRQAKEKLQKIKNQEMRASLKDQEESYKNLGVNEQKAEMEIEKRHEEKIKSLKKLIKQSHGKLENAQQKIQEEQQTAEQVTANTEAEKAKLDNEQAAQLAALVSSTKQKISAIYSAAKPV